MVVCVLLAFYINALKSYCAHNVKIAMENKPYENLRIFHLNILCKLLSYRHSFQNGNR